MVKVNCAKCNKIVDKFPSRLKKYKRSFCSQKCKSLFYSRTDSNNITFAWKHNRKKKMEEIKKYSESLLSKEYKKITEDLGYICGVSVGDGHISQYSIQLCVSDEEFCKRFVESVERQTGKILKIKKRITPKKREIRGRKCNCQGIYYRCELSSKCFSRFVLEMSKKNTKNKKFIKGYLRGFFDSEGYCGKYLRHRLVGVSNTDKKELKKIEKFLSYFGIKTSTRFRKPENEKYKSPGLLEIKDRKSIEIFQSKIGFSRGVKISRGSHKGKEKNKRVKELIGGYRKKINKNKVISFFNIGLTNREIARKIGISKSHVHYIIKQHRNVLTAEEPK